MPKFSFSPEILKRGFSIARIIKPETGDLCLKFSSERLTIFSFDRRRYSCARVRPDSGQPSDSDWQSGEYYVTVDKTGLFDSDLSSVLISVNDQSLSISATDGDQVRNASLKRKSVRSKRPPIPPLPDLPSVDVPAADFEKLLGQVACSALVKETKTEEEMRMNQVHFYADSGCACSSARYYGSIAYLDGLQLDLSIVSADIPYLKAFCSNAAEGIIKVCQDRSKLYIIDPSTQSVLALSKVSSKKPPLVVLDPAGFQTVLTIDQTQLMKNLGWAQLAIEGTQRLGFNATKASSGSDGEVRLSSDSVELSKFPAVFSRGNSLAADFPVRFFHSIVKHMDGQVCLGFMHPDAPTVLGIFPPVQSGPIRYTHYLQSMRSR